MVCVLTSGALGGNVGVRFAFIACLCDVEARAAAQDALTDKSTAHADTQCYRDAALNRNRVLANASEP